MRKSERLREAATTNEKRETNNLDRKSFSNLNYVFKCCLVDCTYMYSYHCLLFGDKTSAEIEERPGWHTELSQKWSLCFSAFTLWFLCSLTLSLCFCCCSWRFFSFFIWFSSMFAASLSLLSSYYQMLGEQYAHYSLISLTVTEWWWWYRKFAPTKERVSEKKREL